MNFSQFIIISSNILSYIFKYQIYDSWFQDNYNTLVWFRIFLELFLYIIFFDIIKIWLFSLIKCKKKELNPRFWLFYLKIIPIFWFIAWIYYWLKKKNFWKIDLLYIFLANLFYIIYFYIYLVIDIKFHLLSYWLLDFIPMILFFILWIWDIIYTKFILKNKNSLK